MSPLFALGSITGRQFAQGKQDCYPALLSQSWLYALALAIPAMIILAFIAPILRACHQPAETIPYVHEFFKYFLWAMPGIYLTSVNQQFLAGNKRQKFVLGFSVFFLTMQVFLNFGFIFGNFGFPKLGVAGAGLAAVISSYMSLIVSLIYVLRMTKGLWKGKLLKGWMWIKLLLKVGMPIFARTTSNMLMMFFLTIIVGWFGVIAMAANQIANEYMLFVIVPMFGISEASAIVISHAAGEKDFSEIKNLARATTWVALCLSFIVGLIFLFFHHQLASLFITFGAKHAQAIYELAMLLLIIRIATMFFDSVAIGLAGSLQGIYDTKSSMLISIITSWVVAIPLALLFGVTFHYGVAGVLVGIGISKLAAFVALWLRWKTQLRRLGLTPDISQAH
jgi:MATE family multidrug resistance protein